MLPGQHNYYSALQDFNDARRKASIQEVLARLTGRSSELLSYDEVAKKLKLNVRTERGVHDIPLKSIIGSVGRYTEFTRDFLPRKNDDQIRWARVKSLVDILDGEGLPPIDVYQVGEAYFVLDGNHRVSVARNEGFEFISAHVIELKTDISITPDIQPDELIIKAEYADFLEKTDFANLRPGVDLSVSIPGQYIKLLDHIQIHQYFMGIDFQHDISYPEAVVHWFDVVYSSITEPIRERGLLRWFPGRTETDVYLWVSAYRSELERELGWSVPPEAAAEKLASQENPNVDISDTGSWRIAKMVDRYTDRLFGDVLVSITGAEENWQALEQAILLAHKESSVLHGLHVIPLNKKESDIETQVIKTRFDQRCQEVNISGSLVIERGSIPRLVCERALLTDIIVLNVSHPPSPGLSSLRSGLRAIIRNSARPILTVPEKTSPMDNVLLAFDGSAKSKEALFVAAYLAEKWSTNLRVLTIEAEGTQSVQEYARSYLELHKIKAEYMTKKGSFDIFVNAIEEYKINLIVLGSYGGTTIKETIGGNMVNFLLRRAGCSLLICR